MQAPPLQASVKAATGILIGPVNVELAVFAKSTWNRKTFSELLPKLTKKLGDPAGGAVTPSRSEGSRLATLDACWKQTIVAAAPLSIAVRLNAQALAPTKELPLNILNDA